MIVAITERVSDLADDVDALHGQLVVSLDPADAERGPSLGYAQLRIANPVARHEGVAVVVGDENRPGVPDPLVILVRTGKGAVDATLEVRRKGLPVLVRVDAIAGSAVVLRRIGSRGVEDSARTSDRPPDPPPAPPGRKVG